MADDKSSKSVPNLASEVVEMSVAYLKQETIVPIKALGRFVGLGLAGAILLSFSFVVLMVAGLRALQTETGSTFDGTWSFVPYLIVMAAAGVIAAVAASRIGKRS